MHKAIETGSSTLLIHNIVELWRYLGKRRIKQFMLLLVIMLVAVFAEVITIGAVVPFLTALAEPELLFNANWLQPIIEIADIQTQDELLLFLSLAFSLAAIFSSGIRVLLLWMNTRLSASMGLQLRVDIYTKVLNQPYEAHVASNSSDVIATLTEKTQIATNTGIAQVLMLVSAVVMVIAIVSTLLMINVTVALLTFVILGGGYFLTGYWVRKRIRQNGELFAHYQPLAIQCIQEGLGGIRDVIMDSSQVVFTKTYAKTSRHIQFSIAQNAFLGSLPKPLLEMLGIVLIVILAYWLQKSDNTSQSALAVLGALALGSQRLLPALQQIFFSWSQISGNQPVLTNILDQLRIEVPDRQRVSIESRLAFQKNIQLQSVDFHYAGSNTTVLKDINLSIPKGSRIGFIGATGSGKSTLLDIIMGLITPTQGKLLVDHHEIDENNLNQWQANIAHVPQTIFLSDASIAENIAFGVSPEKIDMERVKQAAMQAHIADYVESQMDGYHTHVGEHGFRLSGGQRQRIGIARALYKQAEVIVFDEATSALDTATEVSVMKAIESLARDLTIIVIAHRLSTLQVCEMIYRLDRGRIVSSQSYAELIRLEKKH